MAKEKRVGILPGLCEDVSELQDCVADAKSDIAAIGTKLESMKRLVYRLPEADGMTVRNWLEPPDSVAHDVVSNIWTGSNDADTHFQSHPNAPTAVLNEDWVWGGPSDQTEGWGYIELLQPTWVKDQNQNTGERGDVHFGECCGNPRLLQETLVNTPSADRVILDPVLLPAGIHYLYVRISDASANGGFQLQQSATETGTYANFSGRSWTEKPYVQCMAVPVCEPVPEGWSETPPKICDPVFTPVASGGLTEAEVLALIPPPVVVPNQEICTGDFVDVSSRSGWLHTWTTFYTANSGTVVDGWVQVGSAEVSPNCVTDMTVNVSLGNSYMQLQNANGRVWYDVRLLVNGVAVTTFTFQNYHYEDDIGTTNLDDDITPLGSAHFARSNVPAGATITVEIQRRHNFVMGGAANGTARGRVISGLRSHFNVHYSPTQIVTGRV